MQPQKRLCGSLRGEKFSCVWGPAVFTARASNFPKWGRVQGYRRAQERAAVRPRLDGLRASLAIFWLSFSLNFRSLCARVDRGRETRPRAPVWYRARTPSAFSLVVGNGGALGLPAFFLSPSARGGGVSRARVALAVMIARRGRLRKVSAQISPLPVLKLYFTTSGKTGLQSSPVALDSAAEIARDHSGAAIGT